MVSSDISKAGMKSQKRLFQFGFSKSSFCGIRIFSIKGGFIKLDN